MVAGGLFRHNYLGDIFPMNWRVILNGDPTDLRLLVESFSGPDLLINEEDGVFVLSNREFEELNDVTQIRNIAIKFIERLNGATQLPSKTC
jgi:hypothetical protein